MKTQPPKTVRYRAFAPSRSSKLGSRTFALPGTRLTVEGRNGEECVARIKRICREYRLPVRATLATIRRARLG